MLPARARLLHVGLPKTGTTALQSAASGRRRLLLREGVRYPGDRYNHRQAAMALLHRNRGGGTRQGRQPDPWDRLMAEVEGDRERRVLISNEFIAGWDEPVARRFAAELGPRTHVVLTVRNFASVLPSLWQQYVKTGYREDFERFLSIVLADDPDPTDQPPHFERNDQGAAVSRWVDIVGADRVTVIVVDKAEPARVSISFETMLGLPAGTLNTTEQRGLAVNRSLSAAEASLLLAVNRQLEGYRVAEEDLIRILRRGAASRILDECPPAGPDAQLSLPPWAGEQAAARGLGYAEAIERSGARVIGDLSELGRAPRPAVGHWTMPGLVSTEVAAQAVVGALSAGLHRGSNFGLPARARPRSFSRRVAVLIRRLRRFPGGFRRVLDEG